MEMSEPNISPEAAKRLKTLTRRILNNMIAAAAGEEIVFRTRAKYSLTDVPVVLFDEILDTLGIKPEFHARTRARMYKVAELQQALDNLPE